MKTKLLLLVSIILLAIGCEDMDKTMSDLENYDEFFSTSGSVIINSDTLMLEYGNLRNIGTIKNSQLFLLNLYNMNLKEREYDPISNDMIDNAFISLQLDINSLIGTTLSEGNYSFDSLELRQPFSISSAWLNVSNVNNENHAITKYDLTDGSFQIISNNVYPYTGLPSILVNFKFKFEIGNETNISGNFTGRVLTNDSTNE